MIRGLWDRQAEAIVDIKIGDADTDSYKYETVALLAWWETKKHSKHCHNQRKIFPEFSFCQWYTREGSPGHTCSIEPNCVSENGRTHFSRAEMDKRSKHNLICQPGAR